ncbi:two-component system chemotaxis sensor kinase CheA [Azospirillum lipoferum]|uniref:Chemotaxis protein CheA n=1 Tax=Azospirillum lipoferum TaxID=193 RepID=A0A5A9GD31_AZOLI|nr:MULTISPECIES: response regulator [Azospirillum]KAA0592408.1 response regulator [Azospirillum lipoferum]MCP1614556.1 two-component system chemotaxis sensor kinase CheA [Azospirillum lipoferum]MDW5532613.1 response regulator [Azospirillum sp. NL1]
MDIRQRLLAAFDLEHKDHLSAIRNMLREAEATGAPPDLVDIHRRAHSLKGAARAVDLPEVEAISHRLEAAFIAVQKGEIALDPATVGVVRRSLDAIEDLVAWSLQGGGEVETAGVLADLDALAGDRNGSPAPAPTVPVRNPERRPARPRDRATEADTAALVRIAAQGLERLSETASALLPEVEAQAGLGEQLRAMRQEWRALDRAWRHLRVQIGRGALGGKGANALDGRGALPALMAFERRFRALGGALDGAHRSHDRLLWSMRRWGGGFQQDMRRLRMLPAENQLSGLGRMVRDISRAEGKEVEVDVRGLEVEADRTVLQRLKDPILHIARNAISHGIETPAERLALGKRPAARVTIAASVEGARLRLRIEDDGRGLDRPAILRKAAERGLIDADELSSADEMPLERLTEFLFHPGFSTASHTTELAGRGMGLAIARREVERLQGNLTIADRPGGGTAVTIEVPLSLLSQRLVFVAVQDQTLAIPSADVVRLRTASAETLFSGVGTPMLRIAEEEVPVTSLAALLGMEAPVVPSAERGLSLVVVRAADRRLALAVDRFVATRETVVTAAEETGLDAGRYLGTVLMDDGGPALVLNIPGLMPLPGSTLPAPARPAEEVTPARAHILVVDDSITTRTLEKSILEAHGYRVTLCVDGREALERLSEGMEVGLIISDVEMPRMDGFALLQAVKADKRLAEIPVILVTSRASDEDRERGLRLGADAYIVKTRFDQNELLAGIRRLL